MTLVNEINPSLGIEKEHLGHFVFDISLPMINGNRHGAQNE